MSLKVHSSYFTAKYFFPCVIKANPPYLVLHKISHTTSNGTITSIFFSSHIHTHTHTTNSYTGYCGHNQIQIMNMCSSAIVGKFFPLFRTFSHPKITYLTLFIPCRLIVYFSSFIQVNSPYFLVLPRRLNGKEVDSFIQEIDLSIISY